ncbi:MAG TPA: TolC family protein [Geminicoccaceae bacterium]
MSLTKARHAVALAGLALLAGCAATSPASQGTAPTIGDAVRGTGYGRYVPLPRSGYDRALAERVAALAARPMTAEDAVEVGLLADPNIRSMLLEYQLQREGVIGRLADGRGEAAEPVEWRLVDHVMTNRNRGAGGDGIVFQNSQGYGELYADVAGEVLERANAVRRAYYEAVAANEAAALQDRLLEAAKATAELANEQYRSGTLSRLDQSRRQLAYVEAHKEQVQARQAATAAREALNGALRLSPEARGWPLPERLPDLPAARPEIADVVDLALRNRPDAIAAGVSGAASPLGARIAAEARDAYAKMLTAYDTARFQREAVLPAARAHLEEMQLHYNAMLEDAYELIEAAETNVEAGKEYVEALAEFWIARAELADQVGGRLPDPSAPRVAAAEPAAPAN